MVLSKSLLTTYARLVNVVEGNRRHTYCMFLGVLAFIFGVIIANSLSRSHARAKSIGRKQIQHAMLALETAVCRVKQPACLFPRRLHGIFFKAAISQLFDHQKVRGWTENTQGCSPRSPPLTMPMPWNLKFNKWKWVGGISYLIKYVWRNINQINSYPIKAAWGRQINLIFLLS